MVAMIRLARQPSAGWNGGLLLVFLLVLLPVHFAFAADVFTTTITLKPSGCAGGDPYTYHDYWFSNPLPVGAKVTNMRFGAKLGRSHPYSWDPDPIMVLQFNGQQVGSTFTSSTTGQCHFHSWGESEWIGLPTLWVHSPESAEAYSYNASNKVRLLSVGGGSYAEDGVSVEITYEIGYRLYPYSALYRTGPTEAALDDPLAVRLVRHDGNGLVWNQPITFKILPPENGARLGVDGSFTGSELTVNTDLSGVASVEFEAGTTGGTYYVEASNPETVTGDKVVFEITAFVPQKIEIFRENLSGGWVSAPEHTIPFSPETRFRAKLIGDGGAQAWFKDAVWSTAAPKGEKNVASVYLSPSSENDAILEVSPVSFGVVNLIASKPPEKYTGLKNSSATLRVGGVILDVNGDFDPAAPKDDMDWWVPGALTEKTSAPPPASYGWDTPIQKVWLHVPATAPKGTKNAKVRFEIQNPSQHPGIAMNWPPADEALVDNDLWFEGGKNILLKDVPIDVDGFTSVELYVGDYAASATLAVTIDGGATYTVKVPRTKSSGWNALPETGWWALQNFELDQHIHINSAIVNPAADSDSIQPVAKVHTTSSGKFENRGLYGDGLTAFQEYRGFIVRGAHRRLNPHWKDLFFIAEDQARGELDRIKSLPLTIHRILPSEAELDAEGLRPMINLNRSSGTEQRAILLRFTDPGPVFLDQNGNQRRAYRIAPGLTFVDGQNYDPFMPVLDAEGNPSYSDLASPNGTKVAEVYPRGLTFQIWPDSEGTLHSIANSPCIVEPSATVVPEGCDQFVLDEESGMLFIAQGDGIMDTPCHPDDDCRAFDHHDCVTTLLYGLKAQDLYPSVAAHEFGHALNVYHSHDFADWASQYYEKYCGAIMTYDDAFPKRNFTQFEIEQVRVHENQ